MDPAHVDAALMQSDLFHRVIGDGIWGGALVSAVLGADLPGPGTIQLSQKLRYLGPIGPGDSMTVTVVARQKDAARRAITSDCACTNQDGQVVIEGSATVIAPSEKLHRPRAVEKAASSLPERGAKFRAMIALAEKLPPIVTAVVHPVDANSLGGAVAAARGNLITPVLIGPAAKIHAAAQAAHLDIAPYKLIDTEHSAAAAQMAAQLARRGEVCALMKGSLHSAEFLHPVLEPANNLRTDRRLSHVFLLDVPVHARPLFITDGAINISPDLETKRDIVQNVIDMAHALAIPAPKVTILSAVETVTPKPPSTVDAAALCKMADRGQITGGVIDGPLAFDNAISALAARTKHISSPVAGMADILIAPDLEAGNMLAKQLEYLADAEAAGVVLGARVPVILTSRADSVYSRLASCAVAALIKDYQKRSKP